MVARTGNLEQGTCSWNVKHVGFLGWVQYDPYKDKPLWNGMSIKDLVNLLPKGNLRPNQRITLHWKKTLLCTLSHKLVGNLMWRTSSRLSIILSTFSLPDIKQESVTRKPLMKVLGPSASPSSKCMGEERHPQRLCWEDDECRRGRRD